MAASATSLIVTSNALQTFATSSRETSAAAYRRTLLTRPANDDAAEGRINPAASSTAPPHTRAAVVAMSSDECHTPPIHLRGSRLGFGTQPTTPTGSCDVRISVGQVSPLWS